jgi:tetratricopeptide (TPR) repeat protein
MAKRRFREVGALVISLASLLAVTAPVDSALAADPQPSAVSAASPHEQCFQGTFQSSRPTAEQRIAACSRALQAYEMTEHEVALAHLNRGVARMEMGDKVLASIDYEEALKHYDGLIDAKDPDALALYRRGVSLDGLGQTDRALSNYDEAIKRSPKEPRAFFERGVLLATRKRAYDRAIADFNRVLELAPSDVDAMIRRGDAYGQMGDFGHALADLDRAVNLAPDYARAYIFRGIANGRRKETTLAVADFNAALKIDPRNIDGLVNRAALYAGDHREDLAIGDLTTAIAIQKNNPLAFYNRGYAHFAKGDYKSAIDDYSAAIVLDPAMGLAYNNRCLARTIAGVDLVPALADCATALKTMPTNLDVGITRGFIHLKLGEPAAAIVDYNAVLAVDPNRALALYGRGLAQIRMNHKREGEADQAAAHALSPTVEQRFSIYGVN